MIPEHITIQKTKLEITSNHLSNDSCLIEIDTIKITLLNMTLYTKLLNCSISTITYCNSSITTGHIVITRNSCSFVDVLSLKLEKKVFYLEKPDITISTPLIIDFSLIKRKISKIFNVKSDNDQRFLRKLSFEAHTFLFKFCLSDSHIFNFNFTKATIRNLTLNAKSYKCDICFPNINYNILKGTHGQIIFYKPIFALKLDKCEITLTPQFAENSFFQEVFAIFSYINNIYHGIPKEEREKLPPLKRNISFKFKYVKVTMLNNELAIQMSKINEAKSSAMQNLLQIQSKAIELIKAQKTKNFDLDQFELNSKILLMKLFRESLKSMPKSENYLFIFEGENLQVDLNGPSIANKFIALEQIKEFCPTIKNEEFGKVSGAPITFKSFKSSLKLPHVGEILNFINSNVNGVVYIGKNNGITISDFYHFKIVCDNNQLEILIPQISSKSVTFINLNGDFDKFYIKCTPLILEFFQDNKIGTSLFRLLKFRYRRINFFDFCKLRIQTKINFNIKDFKIGLNDSFHAYSHKDNILIQNEETNFIIEDKEFKINSEITNIKLLTNDGYKNVSNIKNILIILKIPSKNPKNPENIYPTFIPINSYKMIDPNYDPFEKYRTITYTIVINVIFNDIPIFIDLDNLFLILQKVFIQKENKYLIKFYNPPRFTKHLEQHPYLNGFEVNVHLPSFSFSYLKNKINAKIFGESQNFYNFKLTNNRRTTNLFVDYNILNFSSYLNSFVLASIYLNKFTFRKSIEGIKVITESVLADISLDILSLIEEFNIPKFPKKIIKSKIPDLFTINDLNNNFQMSKLILNPKEIKIRFHINDESVLQMNLLDNMFEIHENDTNAKLISFVSNNINGSSLAGEPIFEILNPKIYHANSTTLKIDIIEIENVAFKFKSSDFEMFISIYKKLISQVNFLNLERGTKIQTKHSISFTLQKFSIRLYKNDSLFCSLKSNEIVFKNLIERDSSQIISFSLKSISASQETSDDLFKNMLITTKTPLFSLYIDKAPNLMKYPVFKIIEIQVSSFIIRIPIPFIHQLIEIFPSAESFKVLDLDSMNDIEETPNIIDNNNLNDSDTHNALFCQEFNFHSFNAELNLRRKEKRGVFSEFLNRPFQYQELHIFDVFGTQEQFMAFIKRNLKWTAIKALPKLFFAKKRRDSNDINMELEDKE